MAEVIDKPFELQLGDGSVVKGANMEEALKNLAKMKEDTSAELKRQRDQAAQYQQQLSDLQTQVAALSAPKAPSDPSKFDKNHYYELLNSDPIEAQDYLDRYRWESDPREVRQQFSRVVATVSNLEQQAVAAAFMARHSDDFNPEAAPEIRQITEQLVREGHPYSLNTVEMAWNMGVSQGKIKPLEKQTEAPPPPPNPSLPGGGGGNEDATKYDQMSDADLEKVMRQKGLLR